LFSPGSRLWRARIVAPLCALVTGLCILSTAPARSAGNTPGFVQQVSAHSLNVKSRAATVSSAVTAGDRFVVMVGV
jgi:hypothetical protein